MKFLIIALIAISSAMATTIELNQKKIELGNLGQGDVIAQNGYFMLERTEATPKIVKLNYEIKVTEQQCTQYQTRYYACGGYYGGRVGYPYPGRIGYPGRPYPGPGYPGGYYPYPGPGLCADQMCVRWEPVLVNKSQSLKLNFRKAEKLVSGEVENYELQFTANGNRAAFDVKAPAGYKVKKGLNSVKFSKSLKD